MRGKLFAAIGAVVALTVLATGIGIFSFRTVEGRFAELSEQRLPSIGNAAELALTSTSIATAAAAVANSSTIAQQQGAFNELKTAVAGVNAIRSNFVPNDMNKGLLDSIYAGTDAFETALAALDAATRNSISAQNTKTERMAALFDAYDNLNDTISPIVDDAYFTVVLGGEDAVERSRAIVDNLANVEMAKLRIALELRTESNLLLGLLQTVLNVEDSALWTLFEDKIAASQSKLAELQGQASEYGVGGDAGTFLATLDEMALNALKAGSAGVARTGHDRKQYLESALSLQKAIDDALITQIDDQLFSLTIDTETAVEENSGLISGLLDDQVGQLKATLEIQSFANHFVATLVQGGLMQDPAMIVPVQEKVTASAAHLMTSLDAVSSDEIKATLEQLIAFGDGETGLLQDHAFQLQNSSIAAGQVSEMFAAVEKIGRDVANLIEREQAAVEASAVEIGSLFAKGSLALIAVGITSILAAALIAVFMVDRGLIAPLLGLVKATRSLAEGDHDVQVTAIGRRDEIGELADAIAVFKDNAIERLRLEFEAREERANREARQSQIEGLITDFRLEIEKVLGRVGADMEQMQATAELLNKSSIETAEKASVAAESSASATQNVESIAEATNELAGSITEIGEQVAQATSIVTNASSKARETTDKVTQLADAATKIGEVVTLIQAIAEQTNLLALNATIEAARAGDAGKGFAVVASEVKELATQTSKATEDIASQIEAIQSSTRISVTAIEEIRDTMEQADATTSAIAAAVEEQDASTSMISNNIREAAGDTLSATENVDGVKKAVAEAAQSAGQVEMVSNEVAGEASHLKQVVDDFLQKVAAA